MPVGPNTPLEFISDTIDSFTYYTNSTYKIIIADDSHQGLGKKIGEIYPGLDIIYTKKNSGSMAGLYVTLSIAFDYAITNYDFKLLLKLDTDALVIGNEPEIEMLKLVEANPNIGIAGQYPVDYHGKPWDRGWPLARIINGTMTWRFIKRPIANVFLRKYYLRALRNGYKTGESVFGGAYFITPHFLETLHRNNLLPSKILGRLNLGEDHLFSLLAKAMGFELGDLCTKNYPFACAWKGLPAAPEELYNTGKKIIHSTRYWNELNEVQIRNFFREKRKDLKNMMTNQSIN